MNFRGGGLNIHFGDTPPEDTTKLWIKSDKPDKVSLRYNLVKPVKLLFNTHALSETTYVLVNNFIYQIGGRTSTNDKAGYATVYAYDLMNETSSSYITLPKGIYDTRISVVGSDIYVFGGSYRNSSITTRSDSSSDIYCIDTINKTISTLSTKVTGGSGTFSPIRSQAIATVGSDIYLFGGSRGLGVSTNASHNSIYKFNSVDKSMKLMSIGLPCTLSNSIAVTVNDRYVYIFGGYDYSSSAWAYDSYIFRFDAVNQTITTLSVKLPYGAYSNNMQIIGVEGECIYMTLPSSSNSAVNSIYKFDTLHNTIEELSTDIHSEILNSETILSQNNTIYCTNSGADILKQSFIRNLPYNNLMICLDPSDDNFGVITDTIIMNLDVCAVYKGNTEDKAEKVDAYLYKDGEWKLI